MTESDAESLFIKNYGLPMRIILSLFLLFFFQFAQAEPELYCTGVWIVNGEKMPEFTAIYVGISGHEGDSEVHATVEGVEFKKNVFAVDTGSTVYETYSVRPAAEHSSVAFRLDRQVLEVSYATDLEAVQKAFEGRCEKYAPKI